MIYAKSKPEESRNVEFMVVNTSFINDDISGTANKKWDADMWYATRREQPYVVSKLKAYVTDLLEKRGYSGRIQKQVINMLLTGKGGLRAMSNGTSLTISEGSMKLNADDSTHWVSVGYERYNSKDLGWLPVSRIHNHKTVPMVEQMIADNDGNIMYPCNSQDEANEKISSISKDKVFKFGEELNVIPVSKKKFEENLKNWNTWEAKNVARLKERQKELLIAETR